MAWAVAGQTVAGARPGSRLEEPGPGCGLRRDLGAGRALAHSANCFSWKENVDKTYVRRWLPSCQSSGVAWGPALGLGDKITNHLLGLTSLQFVIRSGHMSS